MRTWLTQHRYVLLLTLRQLASKPITNLFSILVMGIALSLPTGMYLVMDNLHHLSEHAASSPQLSLFLKINASQDDVAKIKQRLEENAQVADFQFIPKDVALQQLQQSSGITNIAAGLGRNPLPDAFIVHTHEISSEALEKLRGILQSWPEIAWVQFDSVWIERLEAILNLSRSVVLMLATLLSVAIIAIMFNTIRLQILIKREEIEISKLIGATDSFIQRPFLYFGTIQGLSGGIMAWLIVMLAISILNQELISLAQLYLDARESLDLPLPGLPLSLAVAAPVEW